LSKLDVRNLLTHFIIESSETKVRNNDNDSSSGISNNYIKIVIERSLY